jgi:hypothetical protein
LGIFRIGILVNKTTPTPSYYAGDIYTFMGETNISSGTTARIRVAGRKKLLEVPESSNNKVVTPDATEVLKSN